MSRTYLMASLCVAALACVAADQGPTSDGWTTTVSCTATEKAGNQASGTFTVTVQDKTPPVLTCEPRCRCHPASEGQWYTSRFFT